MQHDLEVANAGRSQTVINNNPPNYQNQNQSYNSQNYNSSNNSENGDNLTPRGFFMYKDWADFNNNRGVNRDELIGFNEPVYDIRNLNSLTFSFVDWDGGIYNGQNLNLKIYNLNDGKIINYFDKECISSKIQDFVCESLYFPESGKYKAVLNVGNSKTLSLDFEIIK